MRKRRRNKDSNTKKICVLLVLHAGELFPLTKDKERLKKEMKGRNKEMSEKCYMCFVSAISQAQRCVGEKEKEKTFQREKGGGGATRGRQREGESRTERQTYRHRSRAKRREAEQLQYLSCSLQAPWLHPFYHSGFHPERTTYRASQSDGLRY